MADFNVRSLVLISAIASLSIFHVSHGLADSSVPQRPLEETVEACEGYHHAAWQMLHAEYERSSRCRSTTRANIGPGRECGMLTKTVRSTILAWPQCGNPDEECALRIAFDDSFDCMNAARKRQREKDNEASQHLSQMKDSEDALNKVKDAYSFLDDPREYITNRIIDKANQSSQTQLRQYFFDEKGKITPLGTQDANDLYAWGFGKITISNKALSENALIRAIQNSSFTSIGNFQQQMISEMLGLKSSIKNFGSELNSPQSAYTKAAPAIPTKKTPRPAVAPECAILSDGLKSSDLSIDHPEEFERLIARCRS
jgi:hypothetical protein